MFMNHSNPLKVQLKFETVSWQLKTTTTAPVKTGFI